MPKVWEDRVKALKKHKVANPYAVATAQLQKQGVLKKGSRKLAGKAKQKRK